VAFLILVTVVGFLAYRGTSSEERERFFAAVIRLLDEVKTVATTPRPDNDAFWNALRARMPRVLVTPALAFVITIVFTGMLFGKGSIGNPDTLLDWGASLGTRTTNGEWWRLLTAVFVHTGTLHLLFNLVALLQLGLILERLAGRLTLAAAYLSAGVFDGLVNLSSHPVVVTVSSSGAIFGLYGLLLAAVIWQVFGRWRTQAEAESPDDDSREVTIPRIALKRCALVGVPFVGFSAVGGHAGTAELVALLVGVMTGLFLLRRVREGAPRYRDIGYATLATAVVALLAALGIGHITDVKPELERVLALEKTTSGIYQAELDALKKGRMSADAVARLADTTIVGELQAADERLAALSHVPPEHQQALADTREFVRLRSESWRARGAALRRAYASAPEKPEGTDDTQWRRQMETRFKLDNAARGHAEGAERISLEALQRITRFLTEHA